jgi:hypothetical protein
MVIKYNNIENRKIVFCILDNLNECDNLIAKDMSINTMDFLIRTMVTQKYDILISSNESDLLTEAVKINNYTHAVVVATGTYSPFGNRFFDEIETLCNQDFFIAGHILDRQDSYLELHKQFYIINLDDYKNLNCPIIEEGNWFLEDLHEEFCPIVSKYGDDINKIIQSVTIGTKKKTYKSKLHGYNILKLALENNKKLIDVGQGLRSSKHYLYHEYDHVFINAYPKIFHQQLFARNVVAPWNTDTVYDKIEFSGPVEQYVTIGTGLNWIRNLTLIGYTSNTEVVFTDINHNCLRFMKELVENWDGIDYDKFYHSFEYFYPSGVPEHVFKNLSAKCEFDEFKNFFDNWNDTWNTIKKLKFSYRLIDYTSEYDLSWIDPTKSTLMNFSDLFNYAALTPLQSVKFKIGAENRLIHNLSKINPDITVIITSRAAEGFKEFNSNTISKVKDLELTTLEELKKLPWHEHDWNKVGRSHLGL